MAATPPRIRIRELRKPARPSQFSTEGRIGVAGILPERKPTGITVTWGHCIRVYMKATLQALGCFLCNIEAILLYPTNDSQIR